MTESSRQIWTGDSLTDAEFSAIIERLRMLRQFDLGQYKDRCVRRRIAKRLRACKVNEFAAYLNLLDVDPNELDTLLAAISIHVSQFFRNPDTFRIIEQKILPSLCRQALPYSARHWPEGRPHAGEALRARMGQHWGYCLPAVQQIRAVQLHSPKTLILLHFSATATMPDFGAPWSTSKYIDTHTPTWA